MTQLRQIPLSQDAALVVALAATAMPFAQSAEDEAEQWLRVTRLHGQGGRALQALGVGEAPLLTGSRKPKAPRRTPPLGAAVADELSRRARHFAAARGGEVVGTADVLLALLDIYGRVFERALYLHGTSREELIERLVQIEDASALGF